MSWMKSLRRRLRNRKHSVRRGDLKKARLRVEMLEDRIAPANNFWLLPVDGNWTDAARWSDGVPTADDDVFIDATGAPFTVLLNTNATVNSVTVNSPDATLNLGIRTLTIAADSSVVNGTLLLDGGTINGTGALTNDAVLTITDRSDFQAAALVQRGTLNLGAGSEFGRLTVTTSFSNSGLISFASTNALVSSLTISGSGVLTNEAGGEVRVETGGPRSIAANIANAGLFQVNGAFDHIASNGLFTNTGTVDVAAGGTLNFLSAGMTFNQDGGTLNAAGSYLMSGDFFVFNGGTVTGVPVLQSTDLTLNHNGAATFSLQGGLDLIGDVSPAQTLRLEDASGLTQVTPVGGLVNNGTIIYDDATPSVSNLVINVGTNTLVNGPTGVILFNQGASNGLRSITGNVTNQGRIDVNAVVTLESNSRTITNTGVINVLAGADLGFSDSTGGSSTFNQDGGQLNVTGRFSMFNDVANFNGGIVAGELIFERTDIAIDPNLGGTSIFTVKGIFNTLSGQLNPGQTFNLQSDGTNGNLNILNEPFINHGLFTVQQVSGTANSFIEGNFVNAADGAVVFAAPASASGFRRWGGDFLNEGRVTSQDPNLFHSNKLAFGIVTPALYENRGDFVVEAGGSWAGVGLMSFIQSAGLVDIQGQLRFAADLFRYDGGRIQGDVVLQSTELGIDPLAVNPATFRMRELNNSITGTILPGHTVILETVAGQTISTELDQATDLTNQGTIIIDDAAALLVEFDLRGNRFFNEGTVQILPGAGPVRQLNVELVNSGSMVIGADTILNQGGADHDNAGTLKIQNGATLTVAGNSFTNSAAGTLAGDGTVNVSGLPNLVSDGVLQPGGDDAAGVLAITGNLTQGAGAQVQTEIGGPIAGTEFDRLAVSGTANLAGSMDVQLLNEFAPLDGATFTVMTYANKTGDFTAFTGLIIENNALAFSAQTNATDVVLTAGPASDLAVTDINVPATGIAGQDVTISYTVTNQGNPTTTSTWVDSLFLSRDDQFDVGVDLLIGRVVHTGDLNTGTSYTETLTAPLPGVVPGTYRIIVIADSQRGVPDLHFSNSRVASSDVLSVDVPLLPLGTPVNGTLAAGQDVFFRLPLQAARDVGLSASVAFSGAAELTVAHGEMPTRSSFDAADLGVRSSHLSILLAATIAGDHFLRLHGTANAGAGAAFTLLAEERVFELREVQNNTGSNLGSATVTLIGSGFTLNTTATLIAADGTERAAQAVRFRDANTLFATFDLTGLVPGRYDMRVDAAAGSSLLPASFTVTAAAAGEFFAFLSGPSATRRGRQSTITITYGNRGGTDLKAPILVLNTAGATLRLPDDPNLGTDTLQLLAGNLEGPVGILPAGFRGTLEVIVEHDGSDNDVDVTFLQAAGDQPLDWDAVKPDLQPTGVPDAAWEAIFANYKRAVGTTIASFQDMLIDNANRLSELGAPTLSTPRLITYELLQADNFGELTARHVSGRFGPGFPDPYDMEAILNADENVAIKVGSEVQFFVRRVDGIFLSLPGSRATLSEQADGSFLFEEITGAQSIFDAAGKLVQLIDARGLVTSFVRDANDRITQAVDPFGRTTTYEFDVNGRVTGQIDKFGRATDFTYDASGRVAQVSYFEGTTSFTYLTGQGVEKDGALATATLLDGTQLFYEYDNAGRLTRVLGDDGSLLVEYNFDSAGQVTIKTGAPSFVSLFHDDAGQVARTVDADGGVHVTQYDTNNDAIFLGARGNRQFVIERDAHGNESRVLDPLGQALEFEYKQPYNQLHAIRDADGTEFTFTFADGPFPTAVTYPDGAVERFEYDGNDNIVTLTNRRGDVTRRFYDASNRLVRQEHADGSVDTLEYDLVGNLIRLTDPTGETRYAYDQAERMTRVDYPNGQFLEFSYDPMGRRTQTRDQDGLEENYAYDQLGRPITVTDASGNLISGFSYDAAHRITRIDRGNGTFTTYTYTPNNLLANIVHHAADGSVLSKFDYTYNEFLVPVSITTVEGTFAYEYDAIGQLTRVVTPDGRDVRYEYDVDGNRTAVTDNGVITAYTANASNQYTSVGNVSFQYDPDGNLVSRTDVNGTTVFSYDDQSRLVRVSGPDGDFQHIYNALGQRIATIQDGVRTDFLIDPTRGDRIVGEYDSAGNLIARYSYGAGLDSRADASGNRAFYSYDGSGNTVVVTGSAGQLLNDYSYLPFGELLRSNELVANRFQFLGQFGVGNEAYGMNAMPARMYDPQLGRFIQQDPIRFAGGFTNLYNYAGNSPVAAVDVNGTNLGKALVGGLIELAAYEITQSAFGEKKTQAGRLTSFVSGLISGSLTGEADHLPGRLIKGVAITAIGYFLEKNLAKAFGEEFKEPSWVDLGVEASFSAIPGGKNGSKFLGKGLKKTFQKLFGSVSKESVGNALGSGGTLDGSDDWTEEDESTRILLDCQARNLSFEECTKLLTAYDMRLRAAKDPNDIIGPAGFGPEGFLTKDNALPYTINFENIATATAPAQEVFITHQLDPDLDFSTFVLGDFGFGDFVFDVPDGRSFFQTQIALTGGLVLEVTAGIDLVTGLASWTFRTLDPLTGDLPFDPFAGFLPPNVDGTEGQGFVQFMVRPKATVVTGDRLDAQATIVFDTNAPIDTPTIFNTIDDGVPTSSMDALPATVNTTSFTISWTGQDDPGGSGIATFDIFVSEDGGPFQLILDDTPLTSATFVGQDGKRYGFFSVATDNVGFVQPTPAGEQTFTVVSLNQPPTAEAGGPYHVNEGASVQLDASGSADPDQAVASLTFAWDLDGDNIFGETGAAAARGDEVGINPTFSAAGLDGPGTITIALRVTDNAVASDTDQATINIVNVAPSIATDHAAVTVNEGDTAGNSGSFSDPGVDTISLSASIGSVVDNGNGTWSWSFGTSDGPDDSQLVSITAIDSDGAQSSVSFQLTVTNVAPSVTADNAAVTVNEGSAAGNTGTFSDPGADTVTLSASIGSVVDNGNGTWSWSFGTSDAPDDSQLVTITATDSDGDASVTSFVLTVQNVAPTADAGGPYSIAEGADLILAGTGSDPSPLDQAALTFRWDLNGDGLFGDAVGATPTMPWSVLQVLGLNNEGVFTITLQVCDEETCTTAQTTLTISNTKPAVTIAGPNDGVRGQPGRFVFETSDASSGDQEAGIVLHINWGDGTSETLPAYGSVTVDHVFTASGSYTLTVTAVDQAGGVSDAVTHTITLTNFAVQVQDGRRVLVVGGSTGDDRILVRADACRDEILVRINERDNHVRLRVGIDPPLDAILVYAQAGDDDIRIEVEQEWAGDLDLIEEVAVFGGAGDDKIRIDVDRLKTRQVVRALVGQIEVSGNDGDDDIRVHIGALKSGGTSPTPGGLLVVRGGAGDDKIQVHVGQFKPQDNPPFERIVLLGGAGDDVLEVSGRVDAVLDGEAGDDHLRGGGGNSLLLGGAGEDRLDGGDGRDVLIGGLGADRLRGQGDADLLIGGTTDHDANTAALEAILREWARPDATYQERVDHLRGILAGGLNDGFVLDTATVHEDGAEDELKGGAGLDLFFAGLGDDVQSKKDELVFWS